MEGSLGCVSVNLLHSARALVAKAGLFVGVILMGLVVSVPSAWAAPPDFQEGSTLFELYCAGCHPQGGNIIRRRKTLKLKSLERDGYDTLEPLADLIAKGQSNMPGFEEKLNTTQIETLSEFVLDQAHHDWKKDVT